MSSNIVGYNKVTLNNEYNLLGSQFVNIGQSAKDINELMASDNDLPGLDDDGEFQTTLRIWTGTSYAYYGWLDADDGTNNEMPEWDSKWLAGDMSDVATFDVNDGEGFWIMIPNGSSATVTMSGEVPTEDSIEVDIAKGFNLVANPFPETISIQDVKSTDLLGLDDDGEFQTTIRVWTGTSYSYFGWLDADDGTNNEMPEWNSSWLDGDMSGLATQTIDIGKGFWVVSPNASGHITFTK